jgi:hypothetical protein
MHRHLVIDAAAPVGLTSFDQSSRGRWLLHLVAYTADWRESFDVLPLIPSVRVLGSPCPLARGSAVVQAVRAGLELVPVRDVYKSSIILKSKTQLPLGKYSAYLDIIKHTS